MDSRIIINTGPLITLARIGCLDVAGRLPFQLIVAIDEWKGRRAALASGLEVTGTLGLLGKAKMLGLIPALRPLVERAMAEGIRYHPELVQAVLEAVEE